jgi:hypothetical protein
MAYTPRSARSAPTLSANARTIQTSRPTVSRTEPLELEFTEAVIELVDAEELSAA